jgi:hypothetical protein
MVRAGGGEEMTINTFAELQQYLTAILQTNISTQSGRDEETDSEKHSPHQAFWKTLTYDEFVDGNVPNVPDPNTGGPMPILVRGDAAKSNFILALQGAKGTDFDPDTGTIGQMPADGPPFLTAAQIQPIADWIDAGCPKG